MKVVTGHVVAGEGGHIVAAGDDCEEAALCVQSQCEAVAFEATDYPVIGYHGVCRFPKCKKSHLGRACLLHHVDQKVIITFTFLHPFIDNSQESYAKIKNQGKNYFI